MNIDARIRFPISRSNQQRPNEASKRTRSGKRWGCWSPILLLALVSWMPNEADAQRTAMAAATVVNGFVVAISVSDGGAGYTLPPKVSISDATGLGATAVATITNGAVNAVRVTSAGIGYSSSPLVVIKAPPGSQFDLTQGLVGYYPFNRDASDKSGAGNNGTVQGATLTTDRFGNTNAAYHFAGNANSYISVPDSASLGITTNITLALWVRVEGGGYAQPRLLSKQVYDFGLYDTSPTPQVFFALNPAVGFVKSSLDLQQNVWTFLTATYDGQVMSLYFDGSLVGQTSASGHIGTNSEPVGMAKNLDDNSDFFPGDLDDVRIYNRALSAAEVDALFRLEAQQVPYLSVAVKSVRVTMILNVGTTNQLETTTDLTHWIPVGGPFVALTPTLSEDFDVLNTTNGLFRVYEIP